MAVFALWGKSHTSKNINTIRIGCNSKITLLILGVHELVERYVDGLRAERKIYAAWNIVFVRARHEISSVPQIRHAGETSK